MSVGNISSARAADIIPLRDPATGRKIRLRLRVMDFAQELTTSLPKDIGKLHGLMVKARQDRNESIYRLVSVRNRLHLADENFWERFNFRSEAEYIVHFGLPDGSTLARWTVMATLFDKPTFVLLGEEVLAYMLQAIVDYQDDTDERKKDYQSIFDAYCKAHDSFDKGAFFETVRAYIEKKYVKSVVRKQGNGEGAGSVPKRLNNGSPMRALVVRPVEQRQAFGPRLSHDVVYESRRCPRCDKKEHTIARLVQHVLMLEGVIARQCGKRLPERPVDIQHLFPQNK